jgi:ASCH domain
MATDEAPVLTVRQPWAWAIIHGGKDVENRSWRTKYRGPLLIHAGSAFEPDGYETVMHSTLERDIADRLREQRVVILGGRLDHLLANHATAQLLLLGRGDDRPIEVHLACSEADLDPSRWPMRLS